jgi:hypothetical protein
MSIVLNATSEFCRALGDIPTYGQAGNREEDKDELMVCLYNFFGAHELVFFIMWVVSFNQLYSPPPTWGM